MAKGNKITGIIKVQIGKTFRSMHKDDPKVTAQEVRAEVNTILRRENPELDPDWPGVSAVGKVITDIKKEMAVGPDPKDAPWSVITLAEYDIPPEALPTVLEVFIDKLKLEPKDAVHLTIREAKWIARLSFVLKDTEQLYRYAIEYANVEEVVDLLDGDDVVGLTDDIGLYGDMTGKSLNSDEIGRVRINWHRDTVRISKKGRKP